MSKTRAMLLATTLAALFTLGAALPGQAQDPKPDEALDKLLEKLEGNKATKDAPAPKAKPKADSTDKAKADKPKADKTKGNVDSKDKDLDDLLGKLGETEEKPTPDDRPKGGSPSDQPPPPKTGAKDPNQPAGQDKPIDDRLEELTGRRRKKDGEKQGEGTGPLSDVVKQMREVEQRLGKTDTGEQTRQRQGEIVKKLETMIEQARESQSQSRSRMMAQQKGQPKPGQNQGNQPGAQAGGAPNQKPEQYKKSNSILAKSKDIWGHLDEQLREEMANVSREEPLPAKDELIKRYYLAVSKKSLSREE